MDPGYTNLLTHLHRGTTTASLPAIQSSLAHYLAHSSPLPTPLAGAAVSSPLFSSLSYGGLRALSTSFRHALHIKFQLAKKDADELQSRGLGLGLVETVFARSVAARMKQWVRAMLRGIQGGNPVLTLVCCSGILLGMKDLDVVSSAEDPSGTGLRLDGSRVKKRVENELIVALAEVMDKYTRQDPTSDWESEFSKGSEESEADTLALSLTFVAQCFSLVSSYKLATLPLQALAQPLTFAIADTFRSGTFLSSLNASCSTTPDDKLNISAAFSSQVDLRSSPLLSEIGHLSKFMARILSLFLQAKPREGVCTAQDILTMLLTLSQRVWDDWRMGPLNGVKEEHIDNDSKDLAKSIWNSLKTLLFMTVMVTSTILREIIFLPPPVYLQTNIATPPDLALLALRILLNLSFVMAQFGGIASVLTSNQDEGFEGMREMYYLALDILAGRVQYNPRQPETRIILAERWVMELCEEIGGGSVPAAMYDQNSVKMATSNLPARSSIGIEASSTGSPSHIETKASCNEVRKAFALASIEQLVPSLSERTLELWVFPVCWSHLFDGTHRDIFESVHSVILAIFASHAQRFSEGGLHQSSASFASTSSPRDAVSSQHPNFCSLLVSIARFSSTRPEQKRNLDYTAVEAAQSQTITGPGFVVRLIPFYAKCLIQNTEDGKLSPTQLRLAFSTLISCATAYATTPDIPTSTEGRFDLAWYCIDSLLDAIRAIGNHPTLAPLPSDEERLHRLHLTLISTISALPLPLLPPVLNEIQAIVMQHEARQRVTISARKKELIEVLFSEILEKVGGQAKEYVMRWWHDNWQNLDHGRIVTESADDTSGRAKKAEHSRTGFVCRL